MTERKLIAQRFLTRLLLGFALVSIGFAAGKHSARSGDNGLSNTPGSAKGAGKGQAPTVIVTYLHATFRCVTCNTIEKMTRDLLESEFAAELEAGTVRMAEVDFQENEALAQRYEVIASCVVVARQHEGSEVAFHRLDEVWTLMKERAAFNRYVGDVIRGYLTQEAK